MLYAIRGYGAGGRSIFFVSIFVSISRVLPILAVKDILYSPKEMKDAILYFVGKGHFPFIFVTGYYLQTKAYDRILIQLIPSAFLDWVYSHLHPKI